MLDVTKNNCFHYDTVICCIKLTELTSFDLIITGPWRQEPWLFVGIYFLFHPKQGAYSRVALIQVNTVMLLTWFASNLLIVHGKKTQAMILGNPFQEPVQTPHRGNNLSSKFS